MGAAMAEQRCLTGIPVGTGRIVVHVQDIFKLRSGIPLHRKTGHPLIELQGKVSNFPGLYFLSVFARYVEGSAAAREERHALPYSSQGTVLRPIGLWL